ncbi:response regulator receiver domain protein [Peptoanaerobacter stomatis]|uniref:Stage 0 sporulation protein A homolog n=1 Tax=Peptoanaerobacter stomatis TaxID=796937 RepID=J5WP90_9FIRM|nr:response regulator transcription factor [Peptoanaerobacter stomatis]EJU23412.1 response regulator receiver domain protein [Peptoanaerobacter stomatis]NWO24233.1 response regulator transcription factor [Peptostreptococcaceae bacterium oral taxon 081]
MIVYIVEDDEDIRQIEEYALKNSGFDTYGFENSISFYEKMEVKLPDIIILDIMLPTENGFEILEYLKSKERYQDIPVIMITAKDMEIDKVKCLDLGADDYIVKPFGLMEFISRVKVVLRRARKDMELDEIRYKNVVIEPKSHNVLVDGEKIVLTNKEYELLKYLMVNKNIVLTRQKLMNNVWGFDFEGETRTVDAHIKSLRQKLGVANNIIKTVRNVGYKIGE